MTGIQNEGASAPFSLPVKRYTYTFGCPVCQKRYRSDEPGEPCCTGPSEMRDEHPMTTMLLVKVDQAEVNPARAEQRAAGELLLPEHGERKLQRDAIIVVSR